jgi:hypothetical protein
LGACHLRTRDFGTSLAMEPRQRNERQAFAAEGNGVADHSHPDGDFQRPDA